MFVWGGGARATSWMKSENNVWESILSCYCVGSGEQTQIVRLGWLASAFACWTILLTWEVLFLVWFSYWHFIISFFPVPIHTYSSLLFVTVVNTMIKVNLWRKGLLHLTALRSHSSLREVRAETQGRNWARDLRDAAYWLAHLLSYTA